MADGLLLSQLKSDRLCSRCFSIIPDPNVDLPIATHAIRCSGDGSLIVNMVGGDGNVTVNFQAGETRQLCVSRVISASGASPIEGIA